METSTYRHRQQSLHQPRRIRAIRRVRSDPLQRDGRLCSCPIDTRKDKLRSRLSARSIRSSAKQSLPELGTALSTEAAMGGWGSRHDRPWNAHHVRWMDCPAVRGSCSYLLESGDYTLRRGLHMLHRLAVSLDATQEIRNPHSPQVLPSIRDLLLDLRARHSLRGFFQQERDLERAHALNPVMQPHTLFRWHHGRIIPEKNKCMV